jgi:hypothetical protein
MKRNSTFLLAALACGSAPAALAQPASAPQLLAESALLSIAGAVPLPGGAPAWRPVVGAGAAIAAACAPASGTAPRLALVSEAPGRLALEGCRAAAEGRTRVESISLGRMAVAVVAPARGTAFALDPAGTFRTFAEAAPRPGTPAQPPLRTVSTAETPSPRLLAPAEGSLGWRVFASAALDPGCAATLGTRLPFSLAEREAACSALRAGNTARRAEGDLAALTSWARQAPLPSVAVVTLPELRALGAEVLPLPFGGVLPTVGNIASGTYPLALGLHLVIVRPPGADEAALTAARDLAFEILSERSLGPAGPVAALGVAPMPPADRVAARATAFTLLRGRS